MTVDVRLAKLEKEIQRLNTLVLGARRAVGGAVAHNILSLIHPDTDPAALVRGDILAVDASPDLARLAIGAAGTFVRSDGVDPLWSVIQVGDLAAHASEHEIGGGDLVDHDLLTNFVMNEHIDHAVITLTAGEGLSGGGTIAANRTFDLDVNGLVEDAAGASGDFFVYYDTVAGDHKKIDWDDMPGGGGASPWTVDVNDIYWDGGGHVSIGSATAIADMTEGLYIFQGASDDKILAFGSSDIIHGMTTITETQVFGYMEKVSGATGGLHIRGLGESMIGIEIAGSVVSDVLVSYAQTNAPVILIGNKKSGTTVTSIADGDILLAVHNLNYPKFMVSGDGSGYFNTKLFVGHAEITNTKLTEGITINQGTSDNEAFAIKSSEVGQPYTTPHESDTYAAFQKYVAAEGGLSIQGMSEVTVGVEIKGGGDTDNTTKNAAGIAPIILNATKSAAGTWGSVGADGNLVAIRNNDSSVWIMDVEGDSWQNGTLHIDGMKSGANQGAAGAAANELWRDTADNSVKLGV